MLPWPRRVLISGVYRLDCVCARVLLGCSERIFCNVTTVGTGLSLPTWPGIPESMFDRWLVPLKIANASPSEASLDSQRKVFLLGLWTAKRQARGCIGLLADESSCDEGLPQASEAVRNIAHERRLA